ncbi:hypothetical protein [Nostoc sp.]|uniref:hypothetical protein n=1 Tax=Nostoc sp. TaxID=1180 RepID=UPI002D78D6C8|nr:hypothetical protein [Nostoc sp.]
MISTNITGKRDEAAVALGGFVFFSRMRLNLGAGIVIRQICIIGLFLVLLWLPNQAAKPPSIFRFVPVKYPIPAGRYA